MARRDSNKPSSTNKISAKINFYFSTCLDLNPAVDRHGQIISLQVLEVTEKRLHLCPVLGIY